MRALPERIVRALEDPSTWLGPNVEGSPAGMRRFQTDLRLRVSEAPEIVTFRKAAFVDIGPVQARADRWEVEISWRASTLAPLFPVFSGSLVLVDGSARLSGLYASATTVGKIADRTLLRVAAVGTGRWLLAALDRAALEDEPG